MIRILVPALLTLFTSVVSAQKSVVLSGRIVTADSAVLSAGNVFLLDEKDSSVVKVTFIKQNSFKFDPVGGGSYLVKISSLGFTGQVQRITLSADTAITVQLAVAPKQIGEVTVYGAKKIFSVKNGNIKVNVNSPMLLASTSGINLLSKLPGIQISPDGESVSILGKGTPLLYLDNQRITVNDLLSLSVSEIKSIEIINNPSAKYEAEGKAVILITRKLNRREGLKVEVAQTFSQRRYRHSWTNTSVSFKKKKLEIKANLQYNLLNQWESNSNNFIIEKDNLSSAYTVTSLGLRKQLIVTGGIYYQLNDHDYLSASISQRYQRQPFAINTISDLNKTGTITNATTYTDNLSKKPYLNSNLNYFKNFKQLNADLFIGAQYSDYYQTLGSRIFNSLDQNPFVYTQQRDQNFNLTALGTRASFTKRIKKETTVEAGATFSKARAGALLTFNDFNPPGYGKVNYLYTESIVGIYSQASGKMGKGRIEAGLRMESDRIRGRFDTASTFLVNRSTNNFFPRVNYYLPLDSTKNLTFNFARSIARPNYSNLSQIITYINPFFEWSSNINLLASITSEISVTFQVKATSIQATAFQRKNPVGYRPSYDTASKKFTISDYNFKKENGVNITLTWPVGYKKWSATNMITGSFAKTVDPLAQSLRTTPSVYFYTSHQVSLPKSLSLFSNFWVTTEHYEGIFKKNTLFALDIGASKTFGKNLSVTLAFNDVFRSINYREQVSFNNVSSNIIYYDDSRELSLNLRYTFGKVKNAGYQNNEINSNSNRIK